MSTQFVPDPSWPTLIELATERWGPPNKTLSSRDDIRWGAKGSKSVRPSTCTWHDHETGEGGGYVELHRLVRGELPKPEPKRKANGELPPWDDIGRIYNYTDADGNLVLQVVRTISGNPRFRQRRPIGNGNKWVWSIKEIPAADRPLYRLPDLRASGDETVWITEGEKDADNLHDEGLIATCSLGGAGKWRNDYAKEFHGKHCIVLQDNDDAGRKHAAMVARSLHGVAASVKLLLLPGLPEKGDVSDWLAAGGTAEDLRRLARDAPELQLSDSPQPQAKRQPRATLNVLTLVTHINATPAWNGALRFNMLTENYEICGSSFPPKDGAKGPPRAFRDPQDTLVAEMYFQANGFAKASKNMTLDALAAVAHQHAYHPVRDYLSKLAWDGTERVQKLFWHYFNAEVPETETELYPHLDYLQHISTGFMVGAVARIIQPGCKHDHVPVVVGRERFLKSSAIRALCHDPAWFSDDISPNLIERDTKESLAGKWLIELAEIPHIQKETERVKAFFSRCIDRYRSAYGRINQDHARQCVFIGTSNHLEFVDVTGNRRFWPFRVAGPIDVAAIVADRDQLWAEAVALYQKGIEWWLPPRIEDIAADQQAAFIDQDIWENLIIKWLESHDRPFTLEDLFAQNTGITPYREASAVDKRDQMRAARCLIKLGLIKRQQRINGRRGIWWQRP